LSDIVQQADVGLFELDLKNKREGRDAFRKKMKNVRRSENQEKY
jgi:hypothetical protein